MTFGKNFRLIPFPIDLSAEAMLTSDLFLGTLRAVMGENLQYYGEKPTFPLSLKCIPTMDARAIISQP